MVNVLQRFRGAQRRSITDALRLRAGSYADYAQLASFHYRAARPATLCRVWVMEDSRPSVLARFGSGTSGNSGFVAAVLVESMPALSCRMRDVETADRYGSWLPVSQRAPLINDAFRTISRVVVHPQWRGLGLAGRLVRHALSNATTRYTEALAAMGRVHPFFERAGMTAYRRPTHPYDARLIDAFEACSLARHDLALLKRIERRIEGMSASRRVWIENEIERWYRRNSGRGRRDDVSREAQLRVAQGRLLLNPVYYLYDRESPSDENT